MTEHLHYFRPGEESRMLARLQFGLYRDGRCGIYMTYPIKGYPWRHNPTRSYEFRVTAQEATELFDEVAELPTKYPNQCLTEELWSDTSEKANNIPRHAKTGKLCHTIGIFQSTGKASVYFSMEEDSADLKESRIYKMITVLAAPHEILPNKPN